MVFNCLFGKTRFFGIGMLFAVSVTDASALSLLDAYQKARENDPVLRAAKFEHEAGQQLAAMGRANLLPQVSLNYGVADNRADRTSQTILGPRTDYPQYRSKSGSVSLRQPLFNMEAVARYQQGVAQAHYSDAIYDTRTRDLVVRLVSAYADAQFADAQLSLALAQRQAFAEQKAVNEKMFVKGEGTKTDMLETQAKYDMAEATVLEAQDNVATARGTLAAIIGEEVNDLEILKDDFQVLPVEPAGFADWKEIALKNNADLKAQRHAVEAARQEVKKNRAGHYPRLDATASYSKSDSESLTTFNQNSINRSVGVQLSIPIYSGGYVNAATRQAVANYERAKAELDDKTGRMLVELRKQYNAVISSASRIQAQSKAVQSAKLLVNATQQSVKGGLRINLDVLNAQQQLYTSLRDLTQAKANYLIGYLKLRYQAGTLNDQDVKRLASYYVPAASSGY
jgi:protease secretion system outer membrane protein